MNNVAEPVSIIINLIRHPSKDFATGDLTAEGIAELYKMLLFEHTLNPEQNYLFYVGPHKRPQQAKEAIIKFLQDSGKKAQIITDQLLNGKFEEISMLTFEELAKLSSLPSKDKQEVFSRIKNARNPEHTSPENEATFVALVLHDFYIKRMPLCHMSVRDMALAIFGFLEKFESMIHCLDFNKLVVYAITHSGVIEPFIKEMIIRVANKKPPEVTLTNVGGIVNYLQGPKITLTLDRKSKTISRIMEYKHLVFNF